MWPSSGESTGLRSVETKPTKKQHPLEFRALKQAKELGATHVYFRYFPEPNRAPKAEVFIFDQTEESPDELGLAESARLLWNTGAAPFIFIFRSDRVDIINTMKEPKLNSTSLTPKYLPAETINFANELAGQLEEEKRKRFSALAFDNGTFWENPDNSPLFNNTKTALQSMLKGMRELRATVESAGFEKDLTNRLLILCLMIKFLEDRKALSSNFFHGSSDKPTEFFQVLASSRSFLKCLAALEERFNGDVFSITAEIKAAIKTADLAAFAEFVEGKTNNKQVHFWKLYSFAHLPVEVISYLYEDFIEPLDENGKPQKTSVYTPHHLVDLILDEAMPHTKLRKAKGDFKVIDPACGSGVFLVGAFRRLVDAWRADNDWKQPSAPILKKLLKQNIYGIDSDPQAVELTTFSLGLAICGQMEPSRIWSTLRFDPLQEENIHHQDFFQVIKDQTLDQKFDLVVGNPPFKSSVKSGIAKEIEVSHRDEFPELPDRQVCYLFLREAPRLLKKKALGYLILKDGFLYNLGTENFRRRFFETYHIPHILDFVSIRGMFTGQSRREPADVKIITVGFQNKSPDFKQPLLHATFRKTALVQNRQGFEIDAYDLHWIPRQLACDDPVVWKANLLGGGRLLGMFRKYSHLPTLGDYLKKMKAESDWVFGEGVITGRRTQDASHLTGKSYIPTDAIGPNGIDHSQATKFEEEKLQRPRDKRLFEGSQLLIREHEDLDSGFTKIGAVFSQRVYGVASKVDTQNLEKLANHLTRQRKNLRIFTRFGSQYLVSMQSALQPQELLQMPLGPNLTHPKLTRKELFLANEVEDFQIPFLKYGNNPKKARSANSVTPAQIKKYVFSFLAELTPIYKSLHALAPIELENAFVVPFCFGKKPNRPLGDLTKISSKLDHLLVSEGRPSLRVQRIVRLFHGNVLFFVKPKPLRFWLQSIALRDADDTFAELQDRDSSKPKRK